jgi:hypothetical protein
MNTKLRLGPLPRTDVEKLTIRVSASLKSDLDRYAELYATAWGAPVDVATLIPHMLATFIARDRGFSRARR